MELEQRFTRMKNDINGNPIYYIGIYDLADLAGVSVEELPTFARKVGFKNYRGKKYGTGFTVQSYNLSHSVDALKNEINK